MSEWLSPSVCDFRARCFVNGTMRDSSGSIAPLHGHWHARFKDHPWVKAAEAEGWSKELRSAVVLAMTKAMLEAQHAYQYPVNVNDLMPDGEWVRYARQQADTFAEAREWQQANGERLIGKKSTALRPLADVSRPAFMRMQRASKNRNLHMTEHGLNLARRMTGDRTDGEDAA